jgi:hypothetical protein
VDHRHGHLPIDSPRPVQVSIPRRLSKKKIGFLENRR